VERFENNEVIAKIDNRLNEVVNRMVKRCLDDGQYKQSLGLGLEARRMDIFTESIVRSVSSSVFVHD
jgi:26S proteasome regulatory subunit N2